MICWKRECAMPQCASDRCNDSFQAKTYFGVMGTLNIPWIHCHKDFGLNTPWFKANVDISDDHLSISRGNFSKLSRIDCMCQPPPQVQWTPPYESKHQYCQQFYRIVLQSTAARRLDWKRHDSTPQSFLSSPSTFVYTNDESSKHQTIRLESSIFSTIPLSLCVLRIDSNSNHNNNNIFI